MVVTMRAGGVLGRLRTVAVVEAVDVSTVAMQYTEGSRTDDPPPG
jgi:hypothetical protein